MRIAIIGAQGVGKTTLLKQVKESLKLPETYVFVDEIVRSLVKDKGIQINKNADFESQMAVFSAHFENAMLNPDMVTDRSCIDAYVYSRYNFRKGKFTEIELRDFRTIFLTTLVSYDMIFYLPVEFQLKDDGFRSIDPVFQKEIDELFVEVLQTFDINFISLTGDIDSRVEQFLKCYYEKKQGGNQV